MKRVIIESPYAGDIPTNVMYAQRCVRDSVLRGEAPIASHLLFTQPNILDDENPEERTLGIAAGHAWMRVADACVVYLDRGLSRGMRLGILAASLCGIEIECRWLQGHNTQTILVMEAEVREIIRQRTVEPIHASQ